MLRMDWLPPRPVGFDSFDEAFHATHDLTNTDEILARLRLLSGCRRNFLQTGKADRLLEKVAQKTDGHLASDLRTVRIAILASHTVEHLVPSVRIAALARSLDARIHVAPYGQYRQAVYGPHADLLAFSPQFILFALDMRDAPLDLPLSASLADVDEAVLRRTDELRALWRHAMATFGATIIQQTFLNVDPPVFGAFEQLVPASRASVLLRLHLSLAQAAREEGVLLLDMDECTTLAGGLPELHDAIRWHQAKQFVSPHAAIIWGDVLARIIAAACGLSRKCLIVDLDNTLWGGTAGDDGPEYLRLGPGTPDGEAFYVFQEHISRLMQRGIAVAVCSKNDINIAEAAFNQPSMKIQRRDIAVFVANWNNKADNIREISRTLSLGLDAFVFADDNPAEREIVRRELPQVAVPELSDDPSDYPRLISASGWFEAASFTRDDAIRVQNYSADVSRSAARENASDLDSYLQDLNMVMSARRLADSDFSRVLQLLNKTNQFNLTGRRYTGPELRALLSCPSAQIWTFRLADRFGDNGLVSVVILVPNEISPSVSGQDQKLLHIENWIMSCRVLGRGLEHAALAVLIQAMKQNNISDVTADYRQTSRNSMVSGHYASLGFSRTDGTEDGTDTSWALCTHDPIHDATQKACMNIRIVTDE
ncbi:HAD-IIIC family phosphatase [Acetobacter fallax]|uniref:HAD-IIIC family phosphatase n=1 Tax=Acetobacter fallax TaxID=1737473 RepID=A0ABX0K7K2_9PROT|nr:HAD-IIIC family phosphatase [Acetobacter fallax]NHO30986.1 HAD-IIIC family phosphatase [Acetobacter fallax]NHO34543.1 HAD-IIIC family phosphatase [Acetobacter fallax]